MSEQQQQGDAPGTLIVPDPNQALVTVPDGMVYAPAGIMTRADIDMQVSTAKRYPRSITRFRQESMMLATMDQATAETMFYRLPRGGKTIEGPSVRLAEIVAHSWGNLRVASRIVGEDARFVTAQAMAVDMETNVTIMSETRRRITDKSGRRYADDMIAVTANAAVSIAYREAVFRIVPRVYVLPIMEQAKEVSIGKAKPIEQRRAEMLAYYGKLGIVPERIYPVLCVDGRTILGVDDLGEEELLTLRGLATAIKEGTTTIEESFPPLPKKSEPLAEKLKAKAEGK